MTAASGTHEYECTQGNCGYTIFPAAGREDKFFGATFKCPQCGADKDGNVKPGKAPGAPAQAGGWDAMKRAVAKVHDNSVA